jgi:hypothetical protein
MWLYWRKKRKKSFKKTENKLVTENGKQKLEAMMDDICAGEPYDKIAKDVFSQHHSNRSGSRKMNIYIIL